MYRTCLTCTGDLLQNSAIEHLPIGRRIAFDAATGRLWVVCPKCAKWNLVPFDSRLEAIDECERLFRATPTRYATDNIGMARTNDGTTLIRVGKPLGEEFASWRYTMALRQRRRRAYLIAASLTLPPLGAAAVLQVALFSAAVFSPALALGSAAALMLGANGVRTAARVRVQMKVRHPRTGKRITLTHDDLHRTILGHDGAENVIEVHQRGTFRNDRLLFRGTAAEDLVPRMLGRLNSVRGSIEETSEALSVLTAHRRDSPATTSISLLTSASSPGNDGAVLLGAAPPVVRLAAEMLSNEDAEERLLRGELEFLERQWREADRLAETVDVLALDAPSTPGSE